jgi:hypothetical protein
VPKALRTQPFDLVLALRLLRPVGTLVPLAAELNVAPSQVHAALTRLAHAGLLKPDARAANPRALGEFLLFGARYCFPAIRGELVLGIPTAYSAQPLAARLDAVDVLVWPAPKCADPVRGFAITPLYAGALKLSDTSPETYRLLTVVDAIRIGDARVRNAAREELERALEWRAS